MKRTASSQASIEQPRSEFLTAAAIVAAVNTLALGGKAAYSHFAPHELLAVQVLESSLRDDYHNIVLHFHNVSPNGIYIEKMSIAQPKNHTYSIFFDQTGPLTSVKQWSPESFFPLHVSFQESHRLRLRMPTFPKPDKPDRQVLRLDYTFTELKSVKGAQTKHLSLPLRWSDDRKTYA
jgi:hypothetical protein